MTPNTMAVFKSELHNVFLNVRKRPKVCSSNPVPDRQWTDRRTVGQLDFKSKYYAPTYIVSLVHLGV